jgi:hypothetical protein
MKVFWTHPRYILGPPAQITTYVLLRGNSEGGVDPANLISGQRCSSGDDPVEVIHGDGLYPSEILDVQSGPGVGEDDSSVTPEGIQVSLSEERLEPSDIARQLTGGITELARIGTPSSACLDLRPDPISVENEAAMVLHLESEESEGTDKEAIDVGDPSVTVRREVVIGGMFIAQPQLAKIVPQNSLSLHSAAVGYITGAAPGHDEAGNHQGARAQCDDEDDARGDSDSQKHHSESHRYHADHKALARFFLQMLG